MTFKHKNKWFFLFGVLCLASLGFFLGLQSWNKNLYVSWKPTSERGLAEEDQTQILVNLSLEELTAKADKILFENARLIEDKEQLIFYLGNFLIPDQSTGEHRFLCELFSYVEFSFAAIGMSLSGDHGIMILQSPCRQEEEFELGPFFIPHKKLLSSPEKRSFEFEEIDSYISFYRASLILTPSWILKTVRFFNEEDSEKEFIIKYNPKTSEPFEIFLQDTSNPPELILKQRRNTS